MSSKKSFTVTNPPIIFWLCISIVAFFVILVLAYTIFLPPPHTAMYVCITIFVFIPGTLITFWTKMFRIKVEGIKISVRKGLGLVNFHLDVSEVSSVDWKITETKFGQNEKITIFTAKGDKFPVETLMVNSQKMVKFIEENVDECKIFKICKSLK